MNEYIPIITTVSFFSLIYISSIIYSSEFNVSLVASRSIFIAISYLLITFSWILEISLSVALTVYFLFIITYILFRIDKLNVVINHLRETPMLVYLFSILTCLLITNSVLIHYDEGYLAQVSKSIWLGYTSSEEVKYYLFKSFLWSTLTSYSDVFDTRVGTAIEWSIFLLFVIPLFKRTGNHLFLVLLTILFFTPQTYFTSSYSDGSNAIFLAVVFFTILGFFNGKNTFHELIGPLFLLSVNKSDSEYTIAIILIALVITYLLDFFKKSSSKSKFDLRKLGLLFLSFFGVIVFNFLIESTFPSVAKSYSAQYLNKSNIESFATNQASTDPEIDQSDTDPEIDQSDTDPEIDQSDSIPDSKSTTSDRLVALDISKTFSKTISKTVSKTISRTALQVDAGNLLGSFFNKVKRSIWELRPVFTDLYSFSIFIFAWFIYKYKDFSREEKIGAQLFFILYIGVFLYINLAYVLFFSRSETDLVEIPSFMRYLSRTMLIPMVLLYNFYNARYDLTRFLNDGRLIVLYFILIPLTSYTQIWRIYKPIQHSVHKEIKDVLDQCGINDLKHDSNVHFIDQTAVGETRVIASMYAYPVGMIGGPCIGERNDSYCYPIIKNHNNWMSYMALYGTEYTAVYKINDNFKNNLWPKNVELPPPPFCVRVADWKIVNKKNINN